MIDSRFSCRYGFYLKDGQGGAKRVERVRMQRSKSVARGKDRAGPTDAGASTLVNRNITIGGRRTSMRLEQAMWDALEEICRRQNKTPHELCTTVNETRVESSLTAAVRVYIMTYFRAAATKQRHAQMSRRKLSKALARSGSARRGPRNTELSE